jgi:DNA-binding IclR family transcriptional regulator
MAVISQQDPALTVPGEQSLAARVPTPNTLAVERALQWLFLVAEHQQGASLQQLARQVGCSKSTGFRLLATMERLNMVKREEGSRRYRLGRCARELSCQADERVDLRRVAQPHMEALRDATEETVSLHVVDDDTHVIVEQCESRQEIRRILPLGQRVPPFASPPSAPCVGAGTAAPSPPPRPNFERALRSHVWT